MRLTEEQLVELEQRRAKWRDEGKIRTHRIGTPEELSKAPNERKGGRKAKYANVKTEMKGMKFASRKEAKRYQDLILRQANGEITDLRRQVPYPVSINGMDVCTYIADAVYFEGGELVVEDTKGVRTPIYILKKKLMRAVHGIEIRET